MTIDKKVWYENKRYKLFSPFRLTYKSYFILPENYSYKRKLKEVENIIKFSEKNNNRIRIAGELIVCQGITFVKQILEGEKMNVLELYNSIYNDNRHIVYSMECHDIENNERHYRNWGMKFRFSQL